MSTLVSLEPVAGESGIVRVILDHPKVNAMGSQLLAQLTLTFEGLATNDAVRAVVLEGRGTCFSAGLDLKEVVELDREGLLAFLGVLDRCLLSVFTCPKPIGCAVAGHAIAGGMVLACTADHLVLGRGDHTLGLTEVAVGVPFPRSAFEIVQGALPPRAARAFVLQPGTRPPGPAFDLGVGDALEDDPADAALAWARQAAALPPVPFRTAKLKMREDGISRIRRYAEAERETLADVILSGETRAAMARALGR